MKLTKTKMGVISATTVAVLVGTFTGFTVTSALADRAPNESSTSEVEQVVVFPKNQQGETYGSAMNARSEKEEPDLIAASGDGEGAPSGYIKKTDLIASRGPSPANPEAAAKLMEALKTNPPKPRVLKLYAEDGKTVIGTKTFEPGFAVSGDAAKMPGDQQ